MKQTINEMIKNDNVYNNIDISIRGMIGPIKSGKDYQANKLVENGYHKISFADALKNICWEIIGWHPITDEDYERFKVGEIYIDNFGFVNGGLMLQRVGQIFRQKDEDFWVKEMSKSIDKLLKMGYTKIVVPDVRYQNELDYIKSFKDSTVIFCNYDSGLLNTRNNNHESEHLAKEYLDLGYKDGTII